MSDVNPRKRWAARVYLEAVGLNYGWEELVGELNMPNKALDNFKETAREFRFVFRFAFALRAVRFSENVTFDQLLKEIYESCAFIWK